MSNNEEEKYSATVIHADCLDYLSTMRKESVDLIYLDPPFFTQKRHTLISRTGDEHSFSDKWKDNVDYSNFMKQCLNRCYEVLKKDGIILVHCDTNSNYILRIILNDIFKPSNFVNEIVWTYKRWSNSKKSLLKDHQTIFVYKKSKNYTFNRIYTEYSATTNLEQILQKRTRDKSNKTVYMKNEGKIVYADKKNGVPLSDVWNIPYLNPKAKERVGYPTQKPLELLERLITIFSNEGDTILDPCCGSGTTLVASKRLNRKAIGIDISKDAVNISKYRINNPIKSKSLLLQNGKESYKFSNKVKEHIIKSFDAKAVYRNKGIDGLINTKNGIIALKIQDKNETIDESIRMIQSAKNKVDIKNGIVLRTHYDNELIPVDYSEDRDIKIIDSYKMMLNSAFDLKDEL